MNHLTELNEESIMLHDELEKLTAVEQYMEGPLLDAVKYKKEYVKVMIENNLALQEDKWFAPPAIESNIIKTFLNNPDLTQNEIAKMLNTTAYRVSRHITQHYKENQQCQKPLMQRR